jgi:hypothetical protein
MAIGIASTRNSSLVAYEEARSNLRPGNGCQFTCNSPPASASVPPIGADVIGGIAIVTAGAKDAMTISGGPRRSQIKQAASTA